jgi:ubiquinone/menaquinone biosynthesis C-methylase UbiE
MKDNFSAQATSYSKYRPVYPPELFEYITGLVKGKDLAWDCGTGNGQTAVELGKYFEKVYATDISNKQIEQAKKESNIIYAIEPAEQTLLAGGSVDLITVSQALHWFNFDKFYEEARRVLKPGGLLAAWSYSLLEIDPVTDIIIHDYHYKTLEKYWDEERKYVDAGYQTIPFPFKELEDPRFVIRLNWNLQALEGYLNTWSALQKFVSANNFNPVAGLVEKIKENWPPEEVRPVIFPIHLKMAYVL